jgi:hypothetical protein
MLAVCNNSAPAVIPIPIGPNNYREEVTNLLYNNLCTFLFTSCINLFPLFNRLNPF